MLASFWPLSVLATWIVVICWAVASLALGLVVGKVIKLGDR